MGSVAAGAMRRTLFCSMILVIALQYDQHLCDLRVVQRQLKSEERLETGLLFSVWRSPWWLCPGSVMRAAPFKDGQHPRLPTFRASPQALIRYCSSRTQPQTGGYSTRYSTRSNPTNHSVQKASHAPKRLTRQKQRLNVQFQSHGQNEPGLEEDHSRISMT